jgi:hypothetical protein
MVIYNGRFRLETTDADGKVRRPEQQFCGKGDFPVSNEFQFDKIGLRIIGKGHSPPAIHSGEKPLYQPCIQIGQGNPGISKITICLPSFSSTRALGTSWG